MGACAHGEVTIHSFRLSLSYLNSHNSKFTVFIVILHILQVCVMYQIGQNAYFSFSLVELVYLQCE